MTCTTTDHGRTGQHEFVPLNDAGEPESLITYPIDIYSPVQDRTMLPSCNTW